MEKHFVDWDDLQKNGQIGDWQFINNDKDMLLAYPSSNSFFTDGPGKDIVYLPIHRAGTVDTRSPSWEWDGNREEPTLCPSINVVGCWHGFLRKGKIETC